MRTWNSQTSNCVQIIPVIDIRNGIAVRAVAGERSQYRPLESRLTDSVQPAEVLKALLREFRFSVCYVADLDAIEARKAGGVAGPLSSTSRCAVAEMVRTGTKLIVDAGVRSVDDARELLDLGVDQVVYSSESLPDVFSLPANLECLGSDSVIFSVDLKHGQLLAADSTWRGRSPIELIETIVRAGIQSVIILDLAAVGVGTGVPTFELCRKVKGRWSGLSLISGGGVHSHQCLLDAELAGIDGLLIASVLHDGRLPPHAIRGWTSMRVPGQYAS